MKEANHASRWRRTERRERVLQRATMLPKWARAPPPSPPPSPPPTPFPSATALLSVACMLFVILRLWRWHASHRARLQAMLQDDETEASRSAVRKRLAIDNVQRSQDVTVRLEGCVALYRQVRSASCRRAPAGLRAARAQPRSRSALRSAADPRAARLRRKSTSRPSRTWSGCARNCRWSTAPSGGLPRSSWRRGDWSSWRRKGASSSCSRSAGGSVTRRSRPSPAAALVGTRRSARMAPRCRHDCVICRALTI